MNLFDYCNQQGFTFAANAKAGKILKQGREKSSDAALAIALKTTAAYKNDKKLQKMCEEALDKAVKAQEKAKAPEKTTRTKTGKEGEPERMW